MSIKIKRFLKKVPKLFYSLTLIFAIISIPPVLFLLVTQQELRSRAKSFFFISDTAIEDLRFLTKFEEKMSQDMAQVVQVHLLPKDSPLLLASNSGELQLSEKLQPVGSPAASLKGVFGDGYKPYVSASLHGAGFDIEPKEEQISALDSDSLLWKWEVMPKKAGHQLLLVTLTFVWKPTNGNNQPEEIYKLGDETIIIEVTEDTFVERGQINIGEIINNGFPALLHMGIGGIISIRDYVLYGKWRRRKKSVKPPKGNREKSKTDIPH